METRVQCSSSLSADGRVDKLASCGLQSTVSLDVNSVLLIGGLSSLPVNSSLSGTLLNTIENSDIADFTLYIDKTKDLSMYIDKTRSLNLLIDKERLQTYYMDKQSDETFYLDKQKDFTLVRER
tara:strand:- start:5204 stop:5575 length:372 start_codon:yes stop_codon:yes gene_type:complete